MWVAARTKPLNPDIFMILIDPVSDLPLELAPVIRVDCVFKINNLTSRAKFLEQSDKERGLKRFWLPFSRAVPGSHPASDLTETISTFIHRNGNVCFCVSYQIIL